MFNDIDDYIKLHDDSFKIKGNIKHDFQFYEFKYRDVKLVKTNFPYIKNLFVIIIWWIISEDFGSIKNNEIIIKFKGDEKSKKIRVRLNIFRLRKAAKSINERLK